ncbi:MAG: tetratricopeptide repeat protein [Polyangiaceae bacterium]|nr:tetratricopeptide repeat protein [Polyangiaceae bacterium]
MRSEPPPTLDGWLVVGAAAESAEDRARALLAHFERALANQPERARLGRLHYECARLCESPLKDLARASEHYAKALAATPDHLPSIHGARRVLLQLGNFQAAIAQFDAEARFTSDPVRRAWLIHEKALLLEYRLHGRKAALTALAQAVELAPGSPAVVESLAQLQTLDEAWEALDHTLDLRVSTVTDARERAAMLAERARLAEARQNDAASATELYQAAITQDPRAPAALLALKDLDHRQRRWRELVSVLELEATQTEDPHVRALALYRVARVHIDHLGSLDDGVRALERAVEATPSDTVILNELARSYETAQRYDGFVRVQEQLVEHSATPSEQVVLLHGVAETCERHLDAENTAIEWYLRALAVDPTHLPTVAALERLYRRKAQWEPLIATLSAAADAARDASRRAAWYAMIGELYEERLNRPDAAVEHYSRALGVLPNHQPSFRALARLLEQQSRFRELVELHERAVDLAPNAETRIAHLFEIGLYLEDALRTPARAIEAYKRVLKEDGKHLGAIIAWQRAAERAQAWRELVNAIETEALQTSDKDAHADLLHRAGEVLAEHLDDLDGALERFKRVLSLVPRHLPALASLARLHERHGRWDDLSDTYRRELKTTPAGPAAAALRMKMAALAERQLGRADEALVLYREAVESQPTHRPARRALERCLQAAEKWAELVTMLEQGLPLLDTPAERARAATRIGELLESRLNDGTKALASYERALAEDPRFGPALDGRLRLLAVARLAPRLADALSASAEGAAEPAIAIAELLREGMIRRDDLNDARGAIRCFEAVLARDPRHLGALRALEVLYVSERAWDRAASVCTALDGVLTDLGARVAVLHRLARIQRDHTGAEPDALRGTYFAILKLDPDDIPALVALEELSLVQGDRKLLAQVDAKLSAMLVEPAMAASHQTRLAETLETADPSAALSLFRAALEKDPDDHAAALGLGRIAERHTDASLLEEAAVHARQVLNDPHTAASLLVRAAGIAQAGGDTARALACLQRALEMAPDHGIAARQLEQALVAAGEVPTLLDALTHAAQRARSRERRDELWLAIAQLQYEHRQDVPAALAAFERVLNESPGHVRALLGEAELLVRDRQWEQATRRLAQALAQSTDDATRVDVHLRLAAIHEEYLQEPDRALAHVNAVLTSQPECRPALLRLLSLQLRSRRYDAATETAQQVIGGSTNASEAAEARVTLAMVERARGNTTQAQRELEAAVAVLGLDGRAAHEYRSLLLEQKQNGHPPAWRSYVNALECFLREVGADSNATSQVELEMSRVLGDELRQNDEALRVLDRGISSRPDDPELHAARAVRLEHAGDLGGAADALRRVLELQVTRAPAWRSLSAILTKMQRSADATLALAPLVAIGSATESDRARLATVPCRAGLAPVGSMTVEEIDALDPLGSSDPALEVLALAGEALPKLYPPDLARYGLATRDRITTRSGHPLRSLSDRVAAIFGVADHQLFEHSANLGSVILELTDPVSLIVPTFVAALPEPQQVFLLARALAEITRRVPVLCRLPSEEIELIVAGAAAAVGVNVPTRLDGGSVTEQGRKIARLLGRRTRRALEERAGQLATGPARDFAEWIHRANVTAARAAVVVTDDLPGSIEIIRRSEGDVSGRTGVEVALAMRVAEDLLRFWVSEPAFRLRRRLGMM